MSTLNLKGELICDEWAEVYRCFGYTEGFYCPADVVSAIEALEPGEELTLLINSIGGHTDAASEIYSTIERSPNVVRAEIQSLAASAASYFIMPCDHIAISLPAQMMIHCASWDVGGNKTDHRWAADQLEEMDRSILDVYCRRVGSKTDRAELQDLMERETYLSARRCLELGLVDAIIGEESAEEPLAMVASVGNNVARCMRTLPDIRTLLERRDQRDSWKREAALKLEAARY